MIKLWVSILNILSAFEYYIADRLGELFSTLVHFFIFWIFPIILLYLPSKVFSIIAIAIASFYVYVLIGDIILSVFGHENLEKKRGMIDISNVHEMRSEIVGALVKYVGGIISFATIYTGLQKIFDGQAFVIATPSSVPHFDFFYFSLITITTVGYGDITAALWLSKMYVMAEVLFGAGFVILLFTMLISLYIDIQRKKKYKD
ncbi:MAG: potassium channel family protein [Acidobacteria bacterium]|nr:potassium channel family protein [Acidobacteriota bacterium]MBU4330462.1 potassium channel family protein [Acidobacteriota bacterium]MBU4494193.1 potassium channel family protein [Acidobacteriota bacterium]MCG2816960.1 potassium channel family protein [Candidatus Aminicenantes bacterium]